MIIYKVTNTLNQKVYIGQTIKSLNVRWSTHGYRTKNTYFANSIRRYGKENFIIEEIDRASNREELNEKEVYWIQFYDSTNKDKGYNIEPGGGSHKKSPETIEKHRIGSLGRKPPPITEETRVKMQLAQLGKKRKPFTEEHKEKMRQKALGRKHTPESKEKMRLYRTGRKNSPEHIEKSRLAHVGKVTSEETKEKQRQSAYKRNKVKLGK